MCRRFLSAVFVLIMIGAFRTSTLAQEPTLAEPQPAVPQVDPPVQKTFAKPEQSPLASASEVSTSSNENRLALLERKINVIEKQLDLILQDLGYSAKYAGYSDARNNMEPANDIELPGGSGRIAWIEKQITSNANSLKDALVAVQDEVTSVREELSATKKEIGRLETTPQSVSATGRLILQNWTGSEQFVLVNGAGHQIPPGRTTLTVPHSILEVFMPRYESARLWGMTNWKQTGDGYEMQVDLRPN